MQRPSHWTRFAAHETAQVPFEQSVPDGHAVPHPPQLVGSTFVCTHEAPHLVVPPAQSSAHAPSEQTRPPPHLLPHAPQLNGSLAVFTQLPAQDVVPPEQVAPSPVLVSPPASTSNAVALSPLQPAALDVTSGIRQPTTNANASHLAQFFARTPIARLR
jgi:hypothetical protein